MTDHRPTPESIPEHHVWTVAEEDAGERLDRYLAARVPTLSRTRIQQLVDEGRALVNGVAQKRSRHVEQGETVSLELPAQETPQLRAEALPVDVLYEDDDVAVVNKPAGVIVHPGAGTTAGTLAGALLHRFGNLSALGGPMRPGIVHRLDKGTSGALIVARNDEAHRALVAQFQGREVAKTYLALVHGSMQQDAGRIELPVARDLQRRIRMTTRRREGRAARTDWRVLLRLPGFSLVEADLHTGRTHQIRVHFAALGHPVVGDTVYGAPREVRAGTRSLAPLGRTFLHAARVSFQHPRTGKQVTARAPLPADLADYLRKLGNALQADEAQVDAALRAHL
jgi:23S rRNA pseudouridine1911/1915/1917 synthase